MKRILALLLALLTLSGCSSMLNRSYRSVTPHVTHTSDPAAPETPEALRAETYGELVNDVQYLVSTGEDTGVIHVYNYTGSLESDLEEVCGELLDQDPLCSWALSDIQWSHSSLISYDECRFTFTYRVDTALLNEVQSAVGFAAIRQRLGQTLAQYDRRLLLMTPAYYGKEELLLQLARQAYYSNPATALGYPRISLRLYPAQGSGSRTLAELYFTYNVDKNTALEQTQRVNAAAVRLTGSTPAQGAVGCWVLCSRLTGLNHYDPQGQPSIFNALVSGGADSEGMALAYQYLCQQAGLECMSVFGTLDGSPHCWNLVNVEDGWRHIDVTSAVQQQDLLRTDSQMSPRYVWDTSQYPACGEETQAE